jgi:hypothetical protein
VSQEDGQQVVDAEELMEHSLLLHEGLGHGDVVEVLDTWCDRSYPGSILASSAFTKVRVRVGGEVAGVMVMVGLCMWLPWSWAAQELFASGCCSEKGRGFFVQAHAEPSSQGFAGATAVLVDLPGVLQTVYECMAARTHSGAIAASAAM